LVFAGVEGIPVGLHGNESIDQQVDSANSGYRMLRLDTVTSLTQALASNTFQAGVGRGVNQRTQPRQPLRQSGLDVAPFAGVDNAMSKGGVHARDRLLER
jgi:hypothetical protein